MKRRKTTGAKDLGILMAVLLHQSGKLTAVAGKLATKRVEVTQQQVVMLFTPIDCRSRRSTCLPTAW